MRELKQLKTTINERDNENQQGKSILLDETIITDITIMKNEIKSNISKSGLSSVLKKMSQQWLKKLKNAYNTLNSKIQVQEKNFKILVKQKKQDLEDINFAIKRRLGKFEESQKLKLLERFEKIDEIEVHIREEKEKLNEMKSELPAVKFQEELKEIRK